MRRPRRLTEAAWKRALELRLPEADLDWIQNLAPENQLAAVEKQGAPARPLQATLQDKPRSAIANGRLDKWVNM
jgi:hypothetical protein